MKAKKPFEHKESFFRGKRLITILIALFIVLIMAGSALNMWGESEEETAYEVNGIKFKDLGYSWQGIKNGQSFTLLSNPKELENMSIPEIDFGRFYPLTKVYFSINPLERPEQAIAILQSNININNNLVPACFSDIPECADYPLKGCNDTTESIGVIILKKANSTKIEFNENCLVIEGESLLKLSEKMVLEYYLKKWA